MNTEYGHGGDQSFDLIKWVNETDDKDISASNLDAACNSGRFSGATAVFFKPRKIEQLLDFVRTEADRSKEQISPATAAKLQKLCHSIANAKFAKSSFVGQIKGFFEDRKIAKQLQSATREIDLYALQNPGTDLESYAVNLLAALKNASRAEQKELAKHILGPKSFLAKCQELPKATDTMKSCFRELAKISYREGQLGVSFPASIMASWAAKELKEALQEEMLASLKPKIKLKLALSQLTNPVPSLKIPPQKGLSSLVRNYVAEAAATTLAEFVGRPRGNLHPDYEQAIVKIIDKVEQFVNMRLELADDKAVKLFVSRPKVSDDTFLKKQVGLQSLLTGSITKFSLNMLTICEQYRGIQEQVAIKRTKAETAVTEAKSEIAVTEEPKVEEQVDQQALNRRASQFLVLPDAIIHFPELFAAENVAKSTLDAVIKRMQRDSSLREFLIDDFKTAMREGKIQPEQIMPEILLDIAQSEQNPNATLVYLLREIVVNNNEAKFNEYKTYINDQFKKMLGLKI